MYNTALSIVLDVSSKNYKGKKSIDIVKKQIIDYLRSIDDENLIYIYDEKNESMTNNKGEQVGMIANYEPSERINLFKGLKKSYDLLSKQDQNLNRILLYITNRFTDKDKVALKKALRFNLSKSFYEETCQLLVIGLDNCGFDSLLSVCDNKVDLMLIHEIDAIRQNLEEYFKEG